MKTIADLLLILACSTSNAIESVDCQPQPEDSRKQVESCLGKPIKFTRIEDDRRLKFDLAWYPTRTQGQFKYFRVAYDPSKKGLVCDAVLEQNSVTPAKSDYVCYPGTGKGGKDLIP